MTGIAIALAALMAAPASAYEIKRQVAGEPVAVAVQHCEYGEGGDGRCREGVTTPVVSSTSTCDYSSYFDEPQTSRCHEETSVLGHTAASEDCTGRTYTDLGWSTYDCTSSTEAGIGSVRAGCKGELHMVNNRDDPSYEDTDMCAARAGTTEVTLVTCSTPRENQLDPWSGLPPVPVCEPAP